MLHTQTGGVGSVDDPFRMPPPEQIPLERSPLVHVLAQVRFAAILAIRNIDAVAPFQEAIRSDYPHFQGDLVEHLTIVPDKKLLGEGRTTIWRFSSLDRSWRISLGPDFVALETFQYKSRDDFMERLTTTLGIVERLYSPAVTFRVGIRYVNRIEGKDGLARLPAMLRAEVSGIAGHALAERVSHSLTETILTLDNDDGFILARWGLLPPNGSFDREGVPPIPQPSWILDIDRFPRRPGGIQSGRHRP